MGALSFLNPIFLFGAFATAVPIIIHLIHRRKFKILQFPAVRFILLAQKRVARKFRIKQWLLLALRILLILLFVAALAQPVLRTASDGLVEQPPALARVIIVDNSFSMEYQTEAGTRWEIAKRVAREWIENLRSQDRVALTPAIREEEIPLDLSLDREHILQQLSNLQIVYSIDNFVSAFSRAYEALKEVTSPAKEIVLITDMTRVPWMGFELERFSVIDPAIKVKIIDLSSTQEEENTTVAGVRFLEQPVTQGVRTHLQGDFQHYAAQTRDRVLVQLSVDEQKMDQKFVTFAQAGEENLRFELQFPQAGYHLGSLKLAKDHLPRDDERLFSVKVEEEVRVLIVDGNPRTALIYSEAYYLANALQPDQFTQNAPIKTKVVTTTEFPQVRLQDYAVVILANVQTLPTPLREELMQFVLSGGGVIFFLGDQVDPLRYNREWYDTTTRLLPGRLQGVREHTEELATLIQGIDTAHPVLQIFQQTRAESLMRAKFRRYFVFEKLSDELTKILLHFSDDQPLLLERPIGKGKAMLFTSTADLDWNDLAIKPAYLPLIQNLVIYLSRGESRRLGEDVVVNQPVDLHLPAGFAGWVQIRRPSGKSTVLQIEKGRESPLYTETTEPGVYQVSLSSGEKAFFVVNLPLAESNLQKIPLSELEKKFHTIPLSVIRWQEEEESVLIADVQGTKLAGILFFLLLCFTAVEGVVANRS